MATTAWLIGSYKNLPAQTLTIGGGGQVVTSASRYLYHSTNSLSMLAQVQAALVAAGYAGASAVLLKNRKVKLSSGAGNFTLNWPGDGIFRDLLGFTGNLSGASSYTATNVSKLLWSPGRTENPQLAPLGVRGHRVHANYTIVSPYDGSAESVTHGSREYNAFTFPYVLKDRVHTAAEAGGEWVAFFDTVCAPAYSFHLWRDVAEDLGSTSNASLTVNLGPYVYTPERRGADWSFVRSGGFEYAEHACDLSFRVHVVPEYS